MALAGAVFQKRAVLSEIQTFGTPDAMMLRGREPTRESVL
jgi:hypothetical protein